MIKIDLTEFYESPQPKILHGLANKFLAYVKDKVSVEMKPHDFYFSSPMFGCN